MFFLSLYKKVVGAHQIWILTTSTEAESDLRVSYSLNKDLPCKLLLQLFGPTLIFFYLKIELKDSFPPLHLQILAAVYHGCKLVCNAVECVRCLIPVRYLGFRIQDFAFVYPCFMCSCCSKNFRNVLLCNSCFKNLLLITLKTFDFTFTFKRSSFWRVQFPHVFLTAECDLRRNFIQYRCVYSEHLMGSLYEHVLWVWCGASGVRIRTNRKHLDTEVNNFLGNICLKIG